MVVLPFNEVLIETLKSRLDEAYEALDKAVLSNRYEDALEAKLIYNRVFPILTKLTSNRVMTSQRGTELEYYLKQYSLGSLTAVFLEQAFDRKRKNFGYSLPPEDHGVGLEQLKSALDDQKTPYWAIKNMAYEIALSGRLDLVVGALRHARADRQLELNTRAA